MSDTGDDDAIDLFQEPEGYYPPEKEPTVAQHTLLSGQVLDIRLVAHNPLWGHHLWNAGRTISDYIEQRSSILIQEQTILELGAGGGLPSLVCALKGAAKVLVTDYPDADLIENLRYNISQCSLLAKPPNVEAEGYLWGAPVQPLLNHLDGNSGFDILILADLLFNHSEHAKLLKTVELTLKRSAEARALVFFTPYRPWLLEKDLAFFDLARQHDFVVEKVFEKVMDKVMFEEDPGDELLRRTVYGYELRWPSGSDTTTRKP